MTQESECVRSMSFQTVGKPLPDRSARVRELGELGFSWADIGEEQYWIDQLVVMGEAVYNKLYAASATLWRIFDKAARFVIGRRDLYKMLAIPEVLWDGLDLVPPQPALELSRYARFDFSVAMDGTIKLLELNADTPTGYVEASIATPWLCSQYGIETPNTSMASQVARAWAKEDPEAAACVAYGSHDEDSGTIEALVRHSGRRMRCIDCLDLWVDEGILKGSDHQPIRRLFALYPKEWMGVDDGGEALAYAVETGELQLFNSLHAVILQSKGLQAVIWGLHELNADLFTEKEHMYIKRYMLPTYNRPLFTGNYVSKSMFGREGGSVRMFDAEGNMDLQDEEGYDTSTLFGDIYQERAELPRIRLHKGEFHLLTGMFVIDGKPCGLLGRAGGLITGNTSHFVAMGVGSFEQQRNKS
ncbi:glutathionylspermidine synthase [Paenibacillus larvae subsp. pulvifaciens]|nr:glutathionylspermidine synthase [Paenibacillus larvae subsp. pulvifaciens]MBH0341291.1 glutathionylspermidine synthase [Paenibacillus larvae]